MNRKYEFLHIGEKTSWGEQILISDHKGRGTIRVYRYNDDPNTLYLAGLYVSNNDRNKNLGVELINSAEFYGSNKLILAVKGKTWLYDWYTRLGYKETDYKSDEDEPETIWMEKLKHNVI